MEKPDAREIAEMESTGLELGVNMNLVTLVAKDAVPLLEKLVPHPVRDEKEVTDVYRALCERGSLECVTVREAMPDLTSKSDIPKVRDYLKSAYPDIR